MVLHIDYSNIITVTITAIITWITSNLYNRIVVVRPRLYISTSTILHSIRCEGTLRYHFSWTCPITIKNNSKYTAINVAFIDEQENKITDINPNNLITKNSHIESYKDLKLETVMTKTVPFEELRYVTIDEDGIQNVTFNMKIQNPEEHYKPSTLKKIKIVLQYQSESGKKFYTLYTKQNNIEKNRFYSINPKYLPILTALMSINIT